jgi:hypothetical protein
MEGIGLRVRRPNDYNPTIAATLGPSAPNPGLNLAAIGQGLTLAHLRAHLEDLREHIAHVRARLEHLRDTSTG